jgi:hypothetical protein
MQVVRGACPEAGRPDSLIEKLVSSHEQAEPLENRINRQDFEITNQILSAADM